MHGSRVGFIGFGTMGAGMARNLAKAGFPLTVATRTPARRRRSRGSSAIGPPRPRRRRTSPGDPTSIVSCLPDAPEVEEVHLGEHGTIRARRRARSSWTAPRSRPEPRDRSRERLANPASAFLDAPVSGGQKGAIEGTLTFFVGGERGALEKAGPVLAAMGKRITHLGPSGAGPARQGRQPDRRRRNARRRFGGHGVRGEVGPSARRPCTRRSWAAPRAPGCSTCSARR